MPKWISYLRIAFAALCGFACVLLLVLWVRSYWRSDGVQGPILWAHGFTLTSFNGRFMFGGGDEEDPITEWDCSSFKYDDQYGPGQMAQFLGPVFAFHPSEEDGAYVHVPHWFLALIAGSIAFLFAKRRRYSLRTVLIVTALIAIGMGTIVYYAKHANPGGMSGSGRGGLANDSRRNSGLQPLTSLT